MPDLVARVLSPEIILVAVITGFLARSWVHVAIGVVIAAVASEMILSAMQITRSPEVENFVIAAAAAGIWASTVFAVQQWRRRSA